MFENAGKKLSSTIKAITLISMIIVAIIGIVRAIEFESIAVFIVNSVVAPLVIWLFSLFTIGKLDMMADVHEIRSTLESIRSTKPNTQAYNSSPVMKDDSIWICTKCKRDNPKEAVYCKHCGEKRNCW